MKLVSWNVNGLRACLKKGFLDGVRELKPDILCIQETKMEEGQAEVDLPGYRQYWNSAEKKGYSGTAVFSKIEPVDVALGMDIPSHDQEGRVIAADYGSFFLVNVYTPNSQRGLVRLGYRMEWEDAFREFLLSLNRNKPVIVCGDLNVAHQEIDIKNAASNRKNAGFTDEERQKMTQLLESGFIDTFRTLYPEQRDAYTWWSYYANSRERNIGWRIDYFLASRNLLPRISQASIHPHISGSDHCPVGLEISLE